jgi:hypothetical protein
MYVMYVCTGKIKQPVRLKKYLRVWKVRTTNVRSSNSCKRSKTYGEVSGSYYISCERPDSIVGVGDGDGS